MILATAIFAAGEGLVQMGRFIHHLARMSAVVAIIVAVVAACTAQAEDQTPGTEPSPTPSPSPVASSTPSVTITTVPTSPTPVSGTPTVTPTSNAPTATPLPDAWTTLDALECTRVHSGVPLPDSPNQWIEVIGRISNPGEEPVEIGSVAPMVVRFYDADGQLITTTRGPIPVDQFEPGQTHTVSLKHEQPELPSARSCQLSINGPDSEPIPMGGTSQAPIEELALP